MSVTTIHQLVPSPTPVTVQHDFWNATRDGGKLFSVRGGIPLTDAFDQLSILLAQGQSVVEAVCEASDTEDARGAAHAAVHLLDFSYALVQAMHDGLVEHEKAMAKP